jgi:hypothetical protein
MEEKYLLIQIFSLLLVLSLYSLLLEKNIGMDKPVIRKAIRYISEFYPIFTLVVLWGYFIYGKNQLNINILYFASACAGMVFDVTVVLNRLHSKGNFKNGPNS